MTSTPRRVSRPSALPRRGHVPPREAERDEWDGGKHFPRDVAECDRDIDTDSATPGGSTLTTVKGTT